MWLSKLFSHWCDVTFHLKINQKNVEPLFGYIPNIDCLDLARLRQTKLWGGKRTAAFVWFVSMMNVIVGGLRLNVLHLTQVHWTTSVIITSMHWPNMYIHHTLSCTCQNSHRKPWFITQQHQEHFNFPIFYCFQCLTYVFHITKKTESVSTCVVGPI